MILNDAPRCVSFIIELNDKESEETLGKRDETSRKGDDKAAATFLLGFRKDRGRSEATSKIRLD